MSDPAAVHDFLRARLDEDEAAARAALAVSSPRWVASNSLLLYLDAGGSPLAEGLACVENYRQNDALRHVERHDPARVLAEVVAKRRIVGCAAEQPETMGEVVAHLAEVYDGHPDYDESWRA